MTDYGTQIREARLAKGWSQEALGRASGVKQSTVDRIEKGGQSKFLVAVAQAVGVNIGGEVAQPPPVEGSRPLPKFFSRDHTMPVYASAEGSQHTGSLVIDSSPFEFLPRPYILENVPEAFAVLIEGDSMFPAYEPGDKVWVNPKLGYRRDMDGIFYANVPGEGRAMIKRLKGWSASEWRVEQWNPNEQFSISRSDYDTVYRVVGKFSKS